MIEIAVMLGGNLPGSAEAIKEALKKFAAAGVEDICTSEVKISEAVDCVPGTPDFLDMAFAGKWAGTELELLELCQRLEREAGRPAIHSSRESRILDCDIIFFGDTVLNSPRLTIPHPRAQQRRFVLEVLVQVAPQMRFADGTSVENALKMLDFQQ
jgi:2-amino-4-hydroxy-6-hydroxymethyldihydropteridine diphosphokinase